MRFDSENVARDLIAFGSVPFFLLVLSRVAMLGRPDYFSQFAVGGVIFLGVAFLLALNLRAGFGLVVLVFMNLYYWNLQFGVLSSVVYLLMIVSLIHLGDDWKKVFWGAVGGGVASWVSWFLGGMIF